MMNRMIPAVASACLLAACGQRTITQELEMVPSTALAHIHLESPLPPELWAYVPEEALPVDREFIQSLSERGPLGICIAGINLTNLEPQLLLLTRDVGPDSMLSIASMYMEFVADSAEGRSDLSSPTGSVIGSIASRDEWTCLYLGPAPQSVMTSWLGLERSRSLAADSSLALISQNGGDASLFIPSGLITFLRVAPIESWVDGWEEVETALSLVQPAAARLDMSFHGYITIEARVVRQGGKVSRVRMELEDTGFTPGEILASLNLLLMAGGML